MIRPRRRSTSLFVLELVLNIAVILYLVNVGARAYWRHVEAERQAAEVEELVEKLDRQASRYRRAVDP